MTCLEQAKKLSTLSPPPHIKLNLHKQRVKPSRREASKNRGVKSPKHQTRPKQKSRRQYVSKHHNPYPDVQYRAKKRMQQQRHQQQRRQQQQQMPKQPSSTNPITNSNPLTPTQHSFPEVKTFNELEESRVENNEIYRSSLNFSNMRVWQHANSGIQSINKSVSHLFGEEEVEKRAKKIYGREGKHNRYQPMFGKAETSFSNCSPIKQMSKSTNSKGSPAPPVPTPFSNTANYSRKQKKSEYTPKHKESTLRSTNPREIWSEDAEKCPIMADVGAQTNLQQPTSNQIHHVFRVKDMQTNQRSGDTGQYHRNKTLGWKMHFWLTVYKPTPIMHPTFQP